MAFSTGYDMKNDFKFHDGLGKMYTAIAVIWSILLMGGAIFIILNRHVPFLRIRNVSLNISAVAILHVYWVLCMLAYGLNGFFPCATEFWIMNVYLPLGIALFHLSNTKLLHVAVLQRKYAIVDSSLSEKEKLIDHGHGWRKHARKLKTSTTYQKTKWSIIIGLIIQLVCALIIFLVSRKFHGGFGLVGEAGPDEPVTKKECRKGWEWVLSIAWQFLWSWIYAPYLLWKVRNIRDTHGWRTQTIVCCVAGLPASPMWLLALYLPEMSKISAYYIPPLWFAPSILLIEAFMIFLPCWHVIKHRRLKKETLEIIAQWERSKSVTSMDSGSSNTPRSPRRVSHKASVVSTMSNRKAHAHMYTMAALDKALQTNATPLLLFAALKDFSGENISFLNHVREWNKNWTHPRFSVLRSSAQLTDEDLHRQQFAKAVEIYSSFVSMRFSDFPINISHTHLKCLEAVFDKPASTVQTEQSDCSNSVTPFDNCTLCTSDVESGYGKDGFSIISTVIDTVSSATENEVNSPSKQSAVVNVYKVRQLGDKLPQTLVIPPNFGPGIFDDAAESVKYMVLTNTWPKFVDAGYAANMERGTAIEKIQDRLSGCGLGRSRVCSF